MLSVIAKLMNANESRTFEALLREKCIELVGTTDPVKLEKILNDGK